MNKPNSKTVKITMRSLLVTLPLSVFPACAACGGQNAAPSSHTEPHARSAALDLPAGTDRDKLHLRLRCTDILGNTSEPLSLRPKTGEKGAAKTD